MALLCTWGLDWPDTAHPVSCYYMFIRDLKRGTIFVACGTEIVACGTEKSTSCFEFYSLCQKTQEKHIHILSYTSCLEVKLTYLHVGYVCKTLSYKGVCVFVLINLGVRVFSGDILSATRPFIATLTRDGYRIFWLMKIKL